MEGQANTELRAWFLLWKGGMINDAKVEWRWTLSVEAVQVYYMQARASRVGEAIIPAQSQDEEEDSMGHAYIHGDAKGLEGSGTQTASEIMDSASGRERLPNGEMPAAELDLGEVTQNIAAPTPGSGA